MNWRFVPIGALAAILLLVSLLLSPVDPSLWELFVVIPSVALLILILLPLLVFPRTQRLSATLLLATAAFIAVGIVGMRFETTLRPVLRWAFFSHKFKQQVLSQTTQPNGTFRHIEWDGWGGAPVGDWTAYVVFDPEDSLKTMTGRWHPGVIRAIPCDVLRVRKLEPRWYSVELEVNEWWNNCTKE